MVDMKKLIKATGIAILIVLAVGLWSYLIFYVTFDYAWDSGWDRGIETAKEIYKLC